MASEVQQFLNLRRSSQFREGCARVEGSGATARDAEAAKGGVNTKGCGIGSIYQHRRGHREHEPVMFPGGKGTHFLTSTWQQEKGQSPTLLTSKGGNRS